MLAVVPRFFDYLTSIALLLSLGANARAGEIVENPNFHGPKTTITYSIWGGADEVSQAKKICTDYVQLHPNIRIEASVYPWGQYWTKMQTEVASGLAPDVMSFYSEAFGVWVARGALYPMDQFVQQDHLNLKDYRKAAIENCLWDGHLYCMPTDIALWAVIYSKSRLEESGIPQSEWPSSTKAMSWDAFQALAEKLTLRKPDGTITQYGMSSGQNWEKVMMSMYGGFPTDRQVDPTRATATNNPAFLKGALDVFDSEYAGGSTIGQVPLNNDSSVNNTDNLLLQSKYAMGTTGPWALAALQKAGIHFGLAPFPNGPNPCQIISVNSLGISSKCKHPKEAFDFIAYVASAPVQRLFARQLKGVPTLTAASDAFINNQYGIKGCEAFLHDVDIASPDLTSDVNDVVSAYNTWISNIGQKLADDQDSELAKVPRHNGAISPADFSAFQAHMKSVVAKDVESSLPDLQSSIQIAFDQAHQADPSFGIGVVAPVVMLVFFAIVAWIYLRAIAANRKKDSHHIDWKGSATGYKFVSPWLVGFFCFSLGPLLAAIVLSFTRWNMVTPPHWIGMQGYLNLWTDSKFWIGLRQTFLYAVLVIPISLIGGLFTAGLLTANIKGAQFFKAVLYIPSLFTGAEAAVIWVSMLNKDHGFLNVGLGYLHLKAINWMDADHAFYAVVMMNLFWIGSSMIIYYAGMKQIPRSYYEAADLDGAGVATKFIKITIPLLSPVILFLVVIATIGAFQVFTPALFFAASSNAIGTPGDSLRFYAVNIYDQAFNNLKMGTACVYAVVLFVIVFIVTMGQIALSRKMVYTESGN